MPADNPGAYTDPNSPVVMELRKRGVPLTAENFNRMNAAMKGAGFGGGNAPSGNMSPMTLSGQMPDDMQYGAKRDEAEAVDNAAEEGGEVDQYAKDMSESDAYLDQIAGKPAAPAGKQKQAASMGQDVVGAGKADMGTGGETEQPELNVGKSNMGGQTPMPDTLPPLEEGGMPEQADRSSMIDDALGLLFGTGAAVAGAKVLNTAMPGQMGARPTASMRSTVSEQPGAFTPQGDMEPPSTKPMQATQAPSTGGPKGDKRPNAKGTETVGKPDKEFEKKSQAGYDKAKSEGRVGRPADKSKSKPAANSNKPPVDKTAARKKAIGAIAKKAARK